MNKLNVELILDLWCFQALVSTAPKACTVMDTNSDISEPYQTIVIVEDNIDSSSVDANVIPANCQEPDSDRSAPSTLTSVHVNKVERVAPLTQAPQSLSRSCSEEMAE